MSTFPDGTTLRPPGLSGYRLYGHDTDLDGRADYDYVNQKTTKWLYVVDEYGLVKQAGIVEEEPIQGLGALLQAATGTPSGHASPLGKVALAGVVSDETSGTLKLLSGE
jgi:hypothetical protein